MEERLHGPLPKAHPTDGVSIGEIVALMGEIYLVTVAVLVVGAAIALTVGVPPVPALIRIDDPAIAANFTA
jgi:hypothetical protein